MNQKIKELLAVLDLPEEEQVRWVDNHIPGALGGVLSQIALAGLAFRLRDEVDYKYYMQAIILVENELCRLKKLNIYYKGKVGTNEAVWVLESQPIHWVIAALIAKELIE